MRGEKEENNKSKGHRKERNERKFTFYVKKRGKKAK